MAKSTTVEVRSSFAGEVKKWASLVHFPHTIFALPFALSMAVIVGATHPVSVYQIIWILVALVSARTAAMAFNRFVDREIDARNPRTADRELPSGSVSVESALLLILVSSVVFLASAVFLGWHCAVMAPFVLALLFGYSLSKRFTRWSHIVLGIALSLAPGGVWYALTAEISGVPVVFMAGVVLWVAGFDILYSLQDVAFDRHNGLWSLPASVGIKRALLSARILHLFSVVSLAVFGLLLNLGLLYFLGVALFAGILVSEHTLVKGGDLSQINRAFFVKNGMASVLFFVFVAADVMTQLT